MPLQGSLSIERMCQLAQVRGGISTAICGAGLQSEEDMTLRAAIQRSGLENRDQYGYRRVLWTVTGRQFDREPQTSHPIDARGQSVGNPRSQTASGPETKG